MVFLKSTFSGIDIPINAFQAYLYAALKKLWGIPNDTDFDLYGRARNNPKEKGSVAEVFDGKAGYTEVLFNDRKLVGQGFFLVGDREDYNVGAMTTKVALILQLNIQGVNKYMNPLDLTKWDDEYINAQVMKLCQGKRAGFFVTGLVKRIENIFKEYPQWKDTIKFQDMFPFHCIRIEFEVQYSVDQCQRT